MITKKILNPVAVINQLKKSGKAFFIFQTLYTKKIMCEDRIFSFTAKSSLRNKDLSFIGQVKNEAKALKNIPQLTSSDVHYVEKSFLKESYSGEIFEIDLTAAYWYFAHKEKFISEKLFKLGLTIPKKTRLIALGALAKKTNILKFDGEKFAPVETVYSTATQGIFFRVAQLTSFLMQDLKFITGNDFLFFWCDAIFVRGHRARDAINDHLEGFGFLFKEYKIDAIYCRNDKINVLSADHAIKHNKGNFLEAWNREFSFEKTEGRRKNNTYKFNEESNNKKIKINVTTEAEAEAETGEETETPF